jgi:hypothetical protein
MLTLAGRAGDVMLERELRRRAVVAFGLVMGFPSQVEKGIGAQVVQSSVKRAT